MGKQKSEELGERLSFPKTTFLLPFLFSGGSLASGERRHPPDLPILRAGRGGGRERHVTNGHVIHDVDTTMDGSDAESALWERQVIYCTPVPGLQPLDRRRTPRCVHPLRYTAGGRRYWRTGAAPQGVTSSRGRG